MVVYFHMPPADSNSRDLRGGGPLGCLPFLVTAPLDCLLVWTYATLYPINLAFSLCQCQCQVPPPAARPTIPF